MKLSRIIAAMLSVLSACSSYGPQSLRPGTGMEAAVATMGRPAAEFALPDGGRRLEFQRGPFGKHTYMVDFDAAGGMLRWEQVLTETKFAQIKNGMSSGEVLRIIGHPSELRPIGFQHEVAWAYRYDTPFCQWFQVGIHNVNRTVTNTAYGIDPACDIGDVSLFLRRP